MDTNSQFTLRNNSGYPCCAGAPEMKLGRWFAGKNKGQCCFRPEESLAYGKVFNIYHLLCVGIALNSAYKLKVTQKLAGGLARGFNPQVWQLKMCTLPAVFFSVSSI